MHNTWHGLHIGYGMYHTAVGTVMDLRLAIRLFIALNI